jgi:hypothetical protein
MNKVNLDFDFEGALSKMHVNVPLKEAIKIRKFGAMIGGSLEMDLKIYVYSCANNWKSHTRCHSFRIIKTLNFHKCTNNS